MTAADEVTLQEWEAMDEDNPPPEFKARSYMSMAEAMRFENVWRDHVRRCKTWLALARSQP